jgi:hypothetical protein
MTWNYRVVKYAYDSGTPVYGVREVYYDKQDNIESWTECVGTLAIGDTKHELIENLNLMLASCFCKPVLELVDGKLVEIDE